MSLMQAINSLLVIDSLMNSTLKERTSTYALNELVKKRVLVLLIINSRINAFHPT